MTKIPEFRSRALRTILRRAAHDNSIGHLHAVIEGEIRAAYKRVEDIDPDSGQLDDECDHVEDLLGLAFVAAQSFITHFRTRLKLLSDVLAEFDAKSSREGGSAGLLKVAPTLPNSKWTSLEVINAIANYWKHRDEWKTSFEPKGQRLAEVWTERTITIEIVSAIGMSPGAAGNLRTGATALGVTNYADLSPIREALNNWASHLEKQAADELARCSLICSANVKIGRNQQPRRASPRGVDNFVVVKSLKAQQESTDLNRKPPSH